MGNCWSDFQGCCVGCLDGPVGCVGCCEQADQVEVYHDYNVHVDTINIYVN